jgi:hypothetical protein
VIAGEVRKRLAQYYYEGKHQEEVRIELHPGAYFRNSSSLQLRALSSLPSLPQSRFFLRR